MERSVAELADAARSLDGRIIVDMLGSSEGRVPPAPDGLACGVAALFAIADCSVLEGAALLGAAGARFCACVLAR